MSEPVLTVLKVCFLAVLYLFIARVVRAVWVEIFSERGERSAAGRSTQRLGGRVGRQTATAATAHPRRRLGIGRRSGDRWEHGRDGRAGRRGRRAAAPGQLVIVEPPDRRGNSFHLADEVTVGRGAGCGVFVDDTFASGLHARVFRREGQLYVEDLGSTNGTYLNRKRVHGPVAIHKGDRLQVGNTVLEVRP